MNTRTKPSREADLEAAPPAARSAFERLAAPFYLALAAVLAWAPVRDPDAWYHLAAGRWMVRNGRVPTEDVWSFTAEGHRWITHEWLYEIGLFLLHAIGGLAALVTLKVLLVGGALLVLDALCRSRRTGIVRVAVITLVAAAAAERFTDRPHLFTFLFGACSLYLLAAPSSRRVWLLVPLAWLWGNIHAGVIYLFAFIGIWGIDHIARLLRDGQRPGDLLALREPMLRRLFLVGVCAVLAAAANPNHIWTFLYPLVVTDTITQAGFITLELLPQHGALAWDRWLIVGLAILALAQARRRPLRETLMVLALSIYAFQWIRERAFFLLMAAPVFATWAEDGLAALRRRMPRLTQPRLTGGLAALACGTAIFAAAPSDRAVHEGPLLMPEELLRFHAAHELPTDVFNPHAWGGHIVWARDEQLRVFLDARLDAFPVSVFVDYLAVTGAAPEWPQILERHGVRCVLLDYSEFYGTGTRRDIRDVLFDDPTWSLVHWSDEGMLFITRMLAEAKGLRAGSVVNPNRRAFDRYAAPAVAAAAVDELTAFTKANPSCIRAQRFLGHVLLRMQDGRAAAHFATVLSAPRAEADDYHAAAYAAALCDDPSLATQLVDQGLRLDRRHAGLREMQRRLSTPAH